MTGAALSVNDVLLLEHDDGDLSDEELFLLQELNSSSNRDPSFPYWEYEPFNLDSYNEDECWADFRFKKDDLVRVCQAFLINEPIISYNRLKVEPLEALCLMLRRLVFPCRYSDLIPKFSRPVPELSIIFNHMIDYIYDTFAVLMTCLDQDWLSPANLKLFADAVYENGAPLDNCWGFVDGTLRGTTRPGKDQRHMYSGHKRKHGFKYQAVTTPNGLIANLFGPIEGCRHDSFMLYQSELLEKLNTHSFAPDGSPLCIYGDPAYPFSLHLQTGFKNPTNDQELIFNQKMSGARVTVEWGFGEVIERFRFTDFTKMQKLGLNSVAKQYVVSAILSNVKTCLYGCKTADYFGCAPPILENYLNL